MESRTKLIGEENMNREKEQKENLLKNLNFVRVQGGVVQLGTPHPLKCPLEGIRENEVPTHLAEIGSFWISKYCTTNAEYEKYDHRHNRPYTSPGDMYPVTDVTYLNVLRYALFFSRKYRLNFTLPTEAQWLYAAAPFGWEYTYEERKEPNRDKAHVYKTGGETYIYGALEVDDPRFGINHFGLYHMGGNVQEITLGWYRAPGHLGYSSDGAYCIVKGGDFGHCQYSAGVHRRGMMDVADKSTRIGFRLACLEVI